MATDKQKENTKKHERFGYPQLQGYISATLAPVSLPLLGKQVVNDIKKSEGVEVLVGGLEGNGNSILADYCSYLAKLINGALLPDFKWPNQLEFISFYSLIEDCWAAGIPVVFLSKIPKPIKRADWVLVKRKNPVIFLIGENNSLGQQTLNLVEALSSLFPWSYKFDNLPQKWAEKFLFPNGVALPKSRSAQSLLTAGSEQGYSPSLFALYACRVFGTKYKGLATQLKKEGGEQFNMELYTRELFDQKLLPRIIGLSAIQQYLLFGALTLSTVTQKKDREIDFLLARLDTYAQLLPTSVLLGAKNFIGRLKVFPEQIQARVGIVELLFGGGVKLTVAEGTIYELSSGAKNFSFSDFTQLAGTEFEKLVEF